MIFFIVIVADKNIESFGYGILCFIIFVVFNQFLEIAPNKKTLGLLTRIADRRQLIKLDARGRQTNYFFV